MNPKKKKLIIITSAVLATLITFVVGYRFGKGGDGHDHQKEKAGGASKATVWTCSMHPSVRSADPTKKCPLCFMDLIPLVEDEMSKSPRGLKVTETARKLAQIETAKAARKYVTKEVRMVGLVEYDETRLATITAWVPGRLDRLYVDYTGISVRKGDHMVYVYSPDIFTAQQELIEAKQSLSKVNNSELKNVVRAAEETLAASREKLRLWGLSKDQIKDIERKGVADDHITINAPIGGIVIHKNATEGEYVKTGTPIYKIADLSQVWVQMDAYESDLAWLRYGQEVEFSAEALPGLTLKGRISFISPILNPKSRTVKVRVNVPNDGSLKPGMFVRASVKSRIADKGKVFDDSLAGKWISPMHPEVQKDEPGNCDVCGIPLVKAETLGFVGEDDTNAQPPLVVPATAPLMTGRRAVVYVQNPEKPELFEGKIVTLGPYAGDFVIIENGLKEGEIVVTKGNFKIDSELQIQAKGSMMNTPYVFDVSEAFQKQMSRLYESYFTLQKSLSEDALVKANRSAEDLLASVRGIEGKKLHALPRKEWLKHRGIIRETAMEIKVATDIEVARKQFDSLSKSMIKLGELFGSGLASDIFIHHCPMAFSDTGASWLQKNDDPFNPYFGAKMLKCAMSKGKLPGNAWTGVKPEKKKSDMEAPTTQDLVPLENLFRVYVQIQKALSKDNVDDAKAAAGEFFSDLSEIEDLGDGWAPQKGELGKAAKAVFLAETLIDARKAFAPLSESLAVAIPRYNKGFRNSVYKARCGMAFNNRGAIWLQDHDKVENPYYGSEMFRCGSVVKTFSHKKESPAEPSKKKTGHEHH